MRIQGVIFDLDGTVADTLPLCIACYRTVFREFLGRDFSDAEIVALFGPTEEGILRRLIPDIWPQALETYIRIYRRDLKTGAQVIPGIEDLLAWLKKHGVQTALVTGKGEETARLTLEMLDLARYFDTVKPGAIEGSIKPRCIEAILADWGLAPDAILHVGDAPSDVTDAQQAGVVPILAAWAPSGSPYPQDKKLQPMTCFQRIPDFMGWLQTRLLSQAKTGA